MGYLGISKLSGLGGFLPLYHTPKGKGFFLSWLTFHLWAGKRGFFWLRACLMKKICIFQVLDYVSSPRRTSVSLGEGENLHTKDWCYA